jgi:hypothetical protein
MTEAYRAPGRRLGRRPPSRAPRLMLRNYLTGVLPEHSTAADHFSRIDDWGLYGNDRFGDCGPVSVANYIKMVTKYLAPAEVSVSQDDVFDLYRRSGNPNFPNDDNGVDMQTMLEALIAGGIGRQKALAFAVVNPRNEEEIKAAISLFGGVLFGVDLELAQQRQTDDYIWDYAPSAEWGGHAVLAGQYFQEPSVVDIAVVTWGQVVGCSGSFLGHQLEEAWVVILPEHLTAKGFQEGVDLDALATDYKALTGRPFPVLPPNDPPQPVDPAVAADRALVQAVGEWPFHAHHGSHETRVVAKALKEWLLVRGYH